MITGICPGLRWYTAFVIHQSSVGPWPVCRYCPVKTEAGWALSRNSGSSSGADDSSFMWLMADMKCSLRCIIWWNIVACEQCDWSLYSQILQQRQYFDEGCWSREILDEGRWSREIPVPWKDFFASCTGIMVNIIYCNCCEHFAMHCWREGHLLSVKLLADTVPHLSWELEHKVIRQANTQVWQPVY